jgi:hypothetical protein
MVFVSRLQSAFVKKFISCISLISIVLFCAVLPAGCENPNGKVGGADETLTYGRGTPVFNDTISALKGVWYSHYAGVGRLDGYRIDKWSNFSKLMKESGKSDLFPDMVEKTYTPQPDGYEPSADDYFVFYDDTVYGESDDGTGGNGGWESSSTRYIGIVRALNIFNGDQNRGAVIIEYLQGCAPAWLDKWPESKSGGRPFFGVYYRVLDRNTVQMANAVDLAALAAGKKYYTETASLREALDLNTVENEAEFISWGVVIPQDRER